MKTKRLVIALMLLGGGGLLGAGCAGPPATQKTEAPPPEQQTRQTRQARRARQREAGRRQRAAQEPDRTGLRAYECADALRFATRVKRDTVVLFLTDRRLALKRAWALDGAKYRGGSTVFWIQGQRSARLKLRGADWRACRRRPQRDAWVTARRRGVDLRAVGHAPRWHLDLAAGGHTAFVAAEDGQSDDEAARGAEPVSVYTPVPDTVRAAPERGAPPAARVEDLPPPYLLYRTETAAHTLAVAVKDETCRDAVSGRRYGKRVVVMLDGQRYAGCGRALR